MLDLECKMLSQAQLFHGLSKRETQLLAFVGSRVSYLAGETIFEQGAPAEAVYVVLAGEVDLRLQSADGHEVQIARFGKGESFGEIGVFNEQARFVAVSAHTDACLLKIPKAEFMQLVRDMPQLSLAVMRDLARRVELLAMRVAELTPH